MAAARLLIVDDSVVVRRLVSRALADEPGIEVVGTAPNGRVALAKVAQLKPDIVTLDLEMPVMGGIECLRQLRVAQPKLPVIVYSSLTRRGAAATIEALTLGATDYLTKPVLVPGEAAAVAAVDAIKAELVTRVRVLLGSATGNHLQLRAVPAGPPPQRRPPPTHGFKVVVIGVSTGGPQALATIIPELPADLPAAVLVVQHMPPLFTATLAQRLAARSQLPVAEVQGGEPLRPGSVWIAPGGAHLLIEGTPASARLALSDAPPENSCRPAADVLFRSAATVFGAHTLGVVLTGMGQDGLRGSRAIRAAGGHVLAQDRASSTVWGMPGSVVEAGQADQVLSLSAIEREIEQLAFGRVRGVQMATEGALPAVANADFELVRRLARRHAGLVIDDGKQYLVEARLRPLAQQEGLANVGELLRALRQAPGGPLALKVVDAMSTKESSFFRDGHPFEALRQHILPRLIEKRRAVRIINIWSAATAYGQEAYSLALVLREMRRELEGFHVRLIASDLSAEALRRAREGRYTQLEVSRGLTDQWLRRYFERRGRGWQVGDELRRAVEFRQINLIEPWPHLPPMDVIMLRNLLIYFDLPAKRDLLARVRGLMKPDSALFLGGAETTHNIAPDYERVSEGKAVWYRIR